MFEALERGMFLDVVGRLAVRDLPADLALVEIDRADPAVRRLAERKPSDAQAAADSPPRRRAGAAPSRRRSVRLPAEDPLPPVSRAPAMALPEM